MEERNETVENELDLEELHPEGIVKDVEDSDLYEESYETEDEDDDEEDVYGEDLDFLEVEDTLTESEDEEVAVPDTESEEAEVPEDTESEEVEYGGEDGRPYSEYETVGTKERVDGSNGVLRIHHIKDEDAEGATKENYQDRLVEYTEKVQAGGSFEGFDGEPIAPRLTDGTHRLTMLPVDSLVFLGGESDRLRQGSLDLLALETSIDEIGQIEPIVVVPLGNPVGYEKDETGEDIEELPLYTRYQVVHGRRRVEALANLGHEYVESIVDTTLPRELLAFYQATATTTKNLTFSEKMGYIGRMRLAQPEMSPDLLEASVGFKIGELPKAEFIDSQKAEFSEIYLKVEKEKLTIEQGFKQIDKELTKREKEEEKAMQEALNGSDGQDVEDVLRDKQNEGNDLTTMNTSAGKQELGDRHILDTALRRAVEARDNSECQICGYAHGVPERADNLKAHHMVAVQYGGSDSLDNLIMLCNNCHEEVHKYEKGRQVYYKETFDKSDEVKKIVVLGNILRRARTMAIKYVRDHDTTLGKQMDTGNITVGKALQKMGVDLGVEKTFVDNSPFKEFKQTTADLDYGGGLTGELAEVWEFDDENELVEEVEVEDELESTIPVNVAEDVEIEPEEYGNDEEELGTEVNLEMSIEDVLAEEEG